MTPFERLEADWERLYLAFERRLVAWHRGLPGPDRDYAARRLAFDAALATVRTGELTDEERAGLGAIHAALPFFDELEPVDGAEPGLPAAEPEAPDIVALRHATYEAYGEAAAAIRVGAETIDRLTALSRLATEPDVAQRRVIFEAMAPVWRSVDGDGAAAGDSPYRRLLASSAARWARSGSAIEANALALGIAPGTFESMLHRMLEAGRTALRDVAGHDGRIEPWDVRYLFGGAERALGGLVTQERLRAINDAHLRSLGADPDTLRIGYDLFDRPGRPVIPVAFTTYGADGPWIFATYREGGLGNLGELIHESGHALHMAAIRTRPAFRYLAEDTSAFFEAVADVIGFDVSDPVFQAHHLGASVDPRTASLDRYGGPLLEACWALFEAELHRSPDRRPNDVWAEIVADGLGLEPHPEWSWWAVRGQLIDLPGYLANYALSAITAAALRARIRDLRGDWSAGDPGWYAFVSETLLRFGAERAPADLIAGLLDGPLTADPLLADLAGADRQETSST